MLYQDTFKKTYCHIIEKGPHRIYDNIYKQRFYLFMFTLFSFYITVQSAQPTITTGCTTSAHTHWWTHIPTHSARWLINNGQKGNVIRAKSGTFFCQVKSQVWKKGLHPSLLYHHLHFQRLSPLLLSSLLHPTLSRALSLSINTSLSPSSALNSHWCFFSSAVSIASWEGGEEGRKGRRERWRYLLINLSWSWPPINQTDKRHWMAEQRRQAGGEGRGSEKHTHTQTHRNTHRWRHTCRGSWKHVWECMQTNTLMKQHTPAHSQCSYV